MPFYNKQGIIPKKRHTVFKKTDGSLYYEELVSREGFSSIYSNLYHLHMPTSVIKIGNFSPINFDKESKKHRARHLRTGAIKNYGDAISSRKVLFFNNDLTIIKSHINKSMNYFYRNAHSDELLFIQSGKGTFKSNFGNLSYKSGDYIIIPRGVLWFMDIEIDTKALVVESSKPIETPKRYRNKFGQLLEHSPYCERDIYVPQLNNPIDEKGEFLVKVKCGNGIQEMIYNHNPFDVIGWDGFFYPWIFNINNFEPIVGSIHQPPPVHQVFQSKGFVICSFVSRLFDFHPDAIPAPYPHSNVDSDEIIFYSKGDFMSRSGIEEESISFHPMGLPHGPQPGKYEASIGKKSTKELAVMIDTFSPLNVAKNLSDIDDNDYPMSWKI